jgi:hypothetical protein
MRFNVSNFPPRGMDASPSIIATPNVSIDGRMESSRTNVRMPPSLLCPCGIQMLSITPTPIEFIRMHGQSGGTDMVGVTASMSS